jgi:hypothetical protein
MLKFSFSPESSHKDNFITLCPLHHHLFDHSRLWKEEWDAFMSLLPKKSAAARVYALEVRLPQLRAFWNGSHNEGNP